MTRGLKLSTGAAFYRQTAARLIQDLPEVIEPLRTGKLCLTTIVEVAKVVTRENVREVLPRFLGLSKQEAKQVAVEISPLAVPTRTVVTPVRAPTSASSPLVLPLTVATESQSLHPDETPADLGQAAPPPPPPPSIQAKTAELSRLSVTVSRAFLEKLDRARDALSHSHPGASVDAILEIGLDLILARQAKRRGLVKKPRKTPPPTTSPDRVPAAVRRAVFARDQGKCQEPLASGGVCGSTYQVELHHLDPEGPSTVDNLSCRCKAHNLAAARKDYGDELIDRYAPRRTPRRPPPPAAREPEAEWAQSTARCRSGPENWTPQRPCVPSQPCRRTARAPSRSASS